MNLVYRVLVEGSRVSLTIMCFQTCMALKRAYLGGTCAYKWGNCASEGEICVSQEAFVPHLMPSRLILGTAEVFYYNFPQCSDRTQPLELPRFGTAHS